MEPYSNPFWDFNKGAESKKRNNTKNSGLPKFLRWSHALRSDQKYVFKSSLSILQLTFHKNVSK